MADVAGLARLATDATLGVAGIAEALHGTIQRLPGPLARSAPRPARGIAGFAYACVRGVTGVVGAAVDAALRLAPSQAADTARSPQGLAFVAALNGVVGDHLDATRNPLALPMTLRRAGDRAAFAAGDVDRSRARRPAPVVVLVHGLCMNDLQWARAGHDHGAALRRDLGTVPAYLRYNTGLPIATNGRSLAGLLEALWDTLPAPRPRLVLLGHSMGGLVVRSACEHAARAGHGWPGALDALVFLGTPHHGATLERAGAHVQRALGWSPYAAPFRRLGGVRSAGIRDLAHGSAAALPSGVACFAVAGSLTDAPEACRAGRVGDGLVSVASALGCHRDPARALHWRDGHARIVPATGHLDLLSAPAVYAHLRRWIAESRGVGASSSATLRRAASLRSR